MSIRMRLFLGMAIILVIGAISSYFIPKYLVDKDIDKAGQRINNLVITREETLYKIVNLFVQERLVAMELALSSQMSQNQMHLLVSELKSAVQNLAQKISADVILVIGDEIAIGSTKTGEYFEPSKQVWETMNKSQGQIEWHGQKLYYQQFDVESTLSSRLFILSEKSTSVLPILNDMRFRIIDKISLNLLWAAIVGLGMALFLLGFLTKRMTRPIVQMAHAAEEIGAGNYEKVSLPEVGNRQDEVAILAKSFDKMRTGLQERETIRGVLNKVVSKEIASQILKNPIELGGEERIVTILFADIRGFTHMTEKMPPQKVISMMNDYLTRMCRIIDAEKGVVDKFVGDEIMALFGAPIDIESPAKHAIATALKMHKESPLAIGIGIHTGLVVAGNQGSENRLNYTVLGANVNLAARLCAAALPGQILVTEAVLQEEGIKEQFAFEKLPPHQFKGFDESIPIFNILS